MTVTSILHHLRKIQIYSLNIDLIWRFVVTLMFMLIFWNVQSCMKLRYTHKLCQRHLKF